MAFQNITGLQLGQAAVTTSYATVYTTPANARTYVKDINLCNTGASPIQIYVHLVPAPEAFGTSATLDLQFTSGTYSVWEDLRSLPGTGNALFYNAPIPGYSTLQWCGVQIMNAGDTLQVKASAAGCTITVTGGEAV